MGVRKPLTILIYCGGELVRAALQPDGGYKCTCCQARVNWLVW